MSMSACDQDALSFDELASELSARCLSAIETGKLDGISNEALGQLFASIVQTFAAKAQNGEDIKPFGRNSVVTATDVAIGCTAMLDAAGLALFELGAWQSMSGVGQKSAGQSGAR